MMQDAQSLSPFEEQQSFSKLKSLDKAGSHNLWFKAHEEKPMQHKRQKNPWFICAEEFKRTMSKQERSRCLLSEVIKTTNIARIANAVQCHS